MPLTRRELLRVAANRIDRADEFSLDVAAQNGLMFDNVRETKGFLLTVANAMIDEFPKWAHLDYV